MDSFRSKTSKFFLLLSICGMGLACEKVDDDKYVLNNPNGITASEIIMITGLDKDSVEADGESRQAIYLKIHPEADLSSRQVRLTTTLGQFVNGRQTDTIIPNASGKATFYLTSNIPGMARVYVQIKNIVIDTLFQFKPALPQDMILTAAKYVIDTSETVSVTASLFRNSFKGKVSDPVKVFYTVTPDVPQSAPLIYPAFDFTQAGKSTIMIANPYFLKGRFKVQATTLGANFDTIRRELFIRIQ